MRRNTFIKVGLVSVFMIAAGMFVGQAKASAASWCGVLAYAPSGNCLAGQDYTALTSLGGSSDQIKSQFINKMHGFENGQHFQRVGAEYIESRLGGNGWEAAINSSDVTLSIQNHSYSTNTAYEPSTDSVVTYADNDTRQSLVIRYKGVVYAAIKLDCGNPVGSITPIPKGWNLNGSTRVSDTSVNPGQTVTFTHNVHNGGPGDASYSWQVQESTGGNYTNSGLPTGSANTPNGGDGPNDRQVSYRVPNNAKKGDIYCQRIQYTNANGPGSAAQNSAPKCVTVGGGGGGSPSSQCTSITINDDGGYNVPGGSSNPRPTQTHVIVHGTSSQNGVPSPAYGTDPGIDTVNSHNPIGNGQSRTWNNLTATSSYIYIQRIRQWKSTNGVWNNYVNTTEAIPCYSATCSISIDGKVPGDPNGVVAGQSFNVHATIINNYYNPPQRSDLPSNVAGHQLSINNGGVDGSGSDWGFSSPYSGIDQGASATHDFTLVAPNDTNAHTLKAHPAYSGLFAFGGGECSMTVNVYKHFTLQPTASSQLFPNSENPASVNYPIGVIQQNDQYTGGIPATLTGTLYRQSGGGAGSTPIANASYSGTYGTTTYNSPPPSGPLTGGVQAGDQYCAQATVNPGTGYVGPSGVFGGQPVSSPLSCDTITNKPYFKVYNGSASAGGNFKQADGTCSSADGGLLAGWNDNTGGVDRGAGSQLSALAMIKITGFASAQTTITRSPTELTFANTRASDISSSTDSPGLGGNYNPGGSRCLTDATAPNGTATQPNGYVQPGVAGINGNQSVFVDGDVYINGNITYANSWATDNPPSFILRATGNIYIAPGVTELDGLYISKNKIYTCAINNGGGNFSPVTGTSIYGGCNNQLVVYGNFVAKKINLLRSYGSLRDEKPTAGTPAGSQTGLSWTTAGPPSGRLPSDGAGRSNCTFIDEPSDPYTWYDNYLCLPSDSSLHLAWTHYDNNPAILGLTGWYPASYLQTHGYPYCTKWDIPAGYGYTWYDNQLCMDRARPDGSPLLQFRTANDPNEFCTNIKESADPQGTWSTSGYFLCEPKAAAATPGGAPTAPACSNRGSRLITSTCAGEVFFLNPSLYFAKPSIQLPSNGATQFDSITSLPPVL